MCISEKVRSLKLLRRKESRVVHWSTVELSSMPRSAMSRKSNWFYWNVRESWKVDFMLILMLSSYLLFASMGLIPCILRQGGSCNCWDWDRFLMVYFLKLANQQWTCCEVEPKSVECKYGKYNYLCYCFTFKQRTALIDNSVIGEALGKYGIMRPYPWDPHCWARQTTFLWPFKVKVPLGWLKKERSYYVEEGDAIIRGNYVNELTSAWIKQWQCSVIS